MLVFFAKRHVEWVENCYHTICCCFLTLLYLQKGMWNGRLLLSNMVVFVVRPYLISLSTTNFSFFPSYDFLPSYPTTLQTNESKSQKKTQTSTLQIDAYPTILKPCETKAYIHYIKLVLTAMKTKTNLLR